jgi:ribosome-associated protein
VPTSRRRTRHHDGLTSANERGTTIDPHAKAHVAAGAAADKLAHDIVILHVGDIIGITDAFVVCSAPNTRQVRTIVDEIQTQLRTRVAAHPRAIEGLDTSTWVLLDYGDIVVHVFLAETREYYGLERLWADAPREELARNEVRGA